VKFLPKFTLHDVQTAVIIFVMAFIGTLLKGGSVTQSLLISAVGAGVGAVAHTYLGKGA
jgi:hypothetical protein